MKGWRVVEHNASMQWSTARIPVPSQSRAGVSRVRSGSRNTAFAVSRRSTARSLTLRASSVTPTK